MSYEACSAGKLIGPATVGGLSLDQNFITNKLISSPPVARIFTITSRIWLKGWWKTVPSTLIDSGASSCFIDRQLVYINKIPTRKKDFPIAVEVIDGRKLESGSISDENLPIRFKIGEHEEELTFNVIKSPKYPLILGMPWLAKHNPRVNWLDRNLSFSCNCYINNKSLNENPLQICTPRYSPPQSDAPMGKVSAEVEKPCPEVAEVGKIKPILNENICNDKPCSLISPKESLSTRELESSWGWRPPIEVIPRGKEKPRRVRTQTPVKRGYRVPSSSSGSDDDRFLHLTDKNSPTISSRYEVFEEIAPEVHINSETATLDFPIEAVINDSTRSSATSITENNEPHPEMTGTRLNPGGLPEQDGECIISQLNVEVLNCTTAVEQKVLAASGDKTIKDLNKNDPIIPHK